MVTLLIFGCHTQLYTPESYTGNQLMFGEGGGFSGQIIEYTLLENGQLFITNSIAKETKPVRKISKNHARALFRQAEKIRMDTLNFNYPGNIYYFIRLQEENQLQATTWGSNDHQVPTAIQNFYQVLSEVTKETKK
jgi:hypothetical protein